MDEYFGWCLRPLLAWRLRCDPKRGRREVAGEFSEPDSEGAVFEAAWSSFEHTEEFHVRLEKGWSYPAGVAPACCISLPCCVPRKQSTQCKTKSGRTRRSALSWPIFSRTHGILRAVQLSMPSLRLLPILYVTLRKRAHGEEARIRSSMTRCVRCFGTILQALAHVTLAALFNVFLDAEALREHVAKQDLYGAFLLKEDWQDIFLEP